MTLQNTQPKGLGVYGRQGLFHIGGYRLSRGDFKALVKEGQDYFNSLAKPEKGDDGTASGDQGSAKKSG